MWDFFNNSANLLYYLNAPDAKTFRHNIKIGYYLPDVLSTLTPMEKFPEVFFDDALAKKYSTIIQQGLDATTLVLAKGRYYYKNYEKVFLPKNYLLLRNSLNICVNPSDVSDSAPGEILYYKEDGKIYCFTISQLMRRFRDGDMSNPVTGKKFNASFVKRFDTLYNDRLTTDGFMSEYFQKKYNFNVQQELKEKKGEKEAETDFWIVVGDAIALLEDMIEENHDGATVCAYCEKHLKNDSLKSIIKHDEGFGIMKFCSFECFENKSL